jgi:FkbM family methyltransferase
VDLGGDFGARLFTRVLAATHINEPGVDPVGFTEALPWRRKAIDSLEAFGARGGFSRRHFLPEDAGPTLAEMARHLDGLAHTDQLLVDPESRELLLDVLTLRALGGHHGRIPVTEREFRGECARIEAQQREATDVERTAAGLALHRYGVPAAGGTVSVIGLGFLVQEFFGEEQYAFSRGGVSIRAEPGDVVVDGGGGWGDTALYFADAVGADGRVLSFEFVPDNLRLFGANLDANPRLADRIEVVRHPVWNEPGHELNFLSAGGQTSVATPDAAGTERVTTESIDHVCEDHGVDRVDFIKLDVEGAEMAALRGARETIRRHRPKLALSLYHQLSDFVEIPAWVDALGLGYRLYLDHRWPGVPETVLFAQPA